MATRNIVVPTIGKIALAPSVPSLQGPTSFNLPPVQEEIRSCCVPTVAITGLLPLLPLGHAPGRFSRKGPWVCSFPILQAR